MTGSSTRQALVLTILAIVVAGGSVLVWRSVASERSTIEDLREIGGDVIVLKHSPKFEEVREVAERVAARPGVVRSEPFSVRSVTFATDRLQADGLLKAVPTSFKSTGAQLPSILAGTGLLQRLGVTAGDVVDVRPRELAEGGVSAPVRCTVLAAKLFRLDFTNDQLALANFDELPRLGLEPTGVDIWLEDVDAGRGLAEALQTEMGPDYQVLSLFDMHLNALGPLRIRRRIHQGLLALTVGLSVAVSLLSLRRQRGRARADNLVALVAVALAWLLGTCVAMLYPAMGGGELVDPPHNAYATLGPGLLGIIMGAAAFFAIGLRRASRVV